MYNVFSGSFAISESCIVFGAYAMKFSLHFVTDIKPVDEFRNALLSDSSVGACQGLQCFIGVREGFAAQNGLYGLCTYSPTCVKVGSNAFFVEQQFVKTF